MKKIIYIALFVVVSLTTAKAQDTPYNFNTIDSSALTINGLHLIGRNKSVLIQNFGQPLSVSQEYWEMDNVTAEKYSYNGIVFYLVKNIVYTFKISKTQYVFSPYKIKVGERLDKLKSVFPLSYKDIKGNSIVLNVKQYDSYIQINANSNQIITSIEFGDY